MILASRSGGAFLIGSGVVIDDPRVIGRILRHLGLQTEVPSAGPSASAAASDGARRHLV
jgi:hypothetical protein